MTGVGGSGRILRSAAIFIASGIVLVAGAATRVTPDTDRTTGLETSFSARADRILTASVAYAKSEWLEESSDAVEALVAPASTSAAVSVVPKTCPATWFCFPRVGLAGPIVPYSDCSGSSEVGSAIRSFNCLGKGYLVGHAYTQFGLIRQWAVGDIVYAYGVRYSVSGAITQSACSAPVFPLAPLSLQTSLTGGACGEVLVVQAR